MTAGIEGGVEIVTDDLVETERVGERRARRLVAPEALHGFGLMSGPVAVRIDGRLPAAGRRERDVRAGVGENVICRRERLQPETRFRPLTPHPIV